MSPATEDDEAWLLSTAADGAVGESETGTEDKGEDGYADEADIGRAEGVELGVKLGEEDDGIKEIGALVIGIAEDGKSVIGSIVGRAVGLRLEGS